MSGKSIAAAFVVDGGIYRHDFVAATVLDALMRIQLDTDTPVLSVVLAPHHFQETEAHRNFFYSHFHLKGAEAARTCLSTVASLAELGKARGSSAFHSPSSGPTVCSREFLRSL